MGISLVIYYLLICFFGITTLFGIDSFLLAAIIPIKTYSNAEAEKKKILKENKNKSGIYMFTNSKNGKKYVGSSVDLYKRLSFYFSTKALKNELKNSQSYIYNALLKDGYENFSLEILEYCSIEELLKREKHFINYFNPKYNIVNDPTLPPMSGRNHSDETKQILSDINKGENNPMFGQNHTKETKTIMSEIKKGKPRPEGSGRPSQQIEVTDNKNNTTTSYDSMIAAAIALNLPSYRAISDYIRQNTKKPYKGQYTFKKL